MDQLDEAIRLLNDFGLVVLFIVATIMVWLAMGD